MRSLILTLFLLGTVFSQLAFSQQMGNRQGMHGKMGGMMQGNPIRHQHVMRNGIAAEYKDKTNPLEANKQAVQQGGQLFQTFCVSCHGDQGKGDGIAGAELNPRPANLAHVVNRRMGTDAFLYWSIAEGGIPLNTAMPPYKDVLQEDQIWQIITYLRTLR